MLAATIVLSACTSDHESPAAPAFTSATSAIPSPPAVPVVNAEVAPACKPGQLSAVSVTAESTHGDPVSGAWIVPFAVVNLGAECALPRRATFVRVRTRVVHFKPTAGALLIPADRHLVLGLRLFRRHGQCSPSTADELPLLFGGRTPSSARAMDLRLARVPGAGLPVDALACGKARLVELQPAQPTSAELRQRARSARPSTGVRLAAGLPPTGPGVPLLPAARGSWLPIFCDESRARFSGGVESSRVLLSIAQRRGSELRELDAWPSAREAELAYRFLLDSVRGCPQHGETGTTTELHEGQLGPRTFEVVASDVGTGAGMSWSRWSVVQRGRFVLIALVSTFDPKSPPARIGTALGDLTAANGIGQPRYGVSRGHQPGTAWRYRS